MPSGIPVATMAINGAKNAAIFVVEMFAISNPELAQKLKAASGKRNVAFMAYIPMKWMFPA